MKFFITLLMTVGALVASEYIHSTDLDLKRNQFYIGPEVYHVARSKEGGANQDGNMIGVRAGYDRLKRYGWYIGGDALYAYGKLNGHTGQDLKIRSHLTDISLEGRAGFTFQQKSCWKLALTPYVGGGYYIEKNHFVNPSPFHLHFKTYYPYAVGGFLFRMFPREQFEIGLNVKVRFPVDPRCRVTNDEDNEPVNQNIKERLQYRVDLPITYRICCEGPFAVVVSPFYEYRHFGGHAGFPFNYIKTQFKIWGAALLLEYQM